MQVVTHNNPLAPSSLATNTDARMHMAAQESPHASLPLPLGADVLACVVIAVCRLEIDEEDEDYPYPPPLSILGQLRLCSRALRDVVDASTPSIRVGAGDRPWSPVPC